MMIGIYVFPLFIFKGTIISFRTNSSPSVWAGYAGHVCAFIL